jgi:hypothetical protein
MRLTQSEVRTLADTGQVDEKISFPNGTALTYRLRIDRTERDVTAFYDGEVMEVVLPDAQGSRWCGTDQIALLATHGLPDGECFRITLEKDFACLVEREGEDESDNFPHPGSPTGTPRC